MHSRRATRVARLVIKWRSLRWGLAGGGVFLRGSVSTTLWWLGGGGSLRCGLAASGVAGCSQAEAELELSESRAGVEQELEPSRSTSWNQTGPELEPEPEQIKFRSWMIRSEARLGAETELEPS